MTSVDGKKGKGKGGKGNQYGIALQEAKDGEVVTRFPPEPSGYLHIGHAKAALLNQYFANAYHGKMIVRFDDTNPSKERVEFHDAILEDLQLMGITADRITYSSDYFQEMYDLAVKLIQDGKAYTDDTEQDKMRAERMDGIASERRERSVEDNIQIFGEMKEASEEGLKNCLRAKISFSNPNKALRDPVIYRCNLIPHQRTGTTWNIYPTYDFCCPIVDSIEGVTHALRTLEYRDRNPQYQWMLKSMGLRKVYIWDFARLNFIRTLLSKRKLQKLVDKGLVWGWDDPRFPTIRGVRRRGMTIEGLKEFILSQGPSKNVVNMDWTTIWQFNKKTIDPVAPRHIAVVRENMVKVHLHGGPASVEEQLKPCHKKNPDLGTKLVQFSSGIIIDQEDAQTFEEGEEITLMDWGNAFVKSFTKDEQGIITELEMTLHLEGDFKMTKKKVTWLADTPQNIAAVLIDFDHLISKDKLEEEDNWEDYITPKTEFRVPALAAMSTSTLQKGDIIQFERKGYYRLDQPQERSTPAQFFSIPDGKSVSKYGVKKY